MTTAHVRPDVLKTFTGVLIRNHWLAKIDEKGYIRVFGHTKTGLSNSFGANVLTVVCFSFDISFIYFLKSRSSDLIFFKNVYPVISEIDKLEDGV